MQYNTAVQNHPRISALVTLEWPYFFILWPWPLLDDLDNELDLDTPKTYQQKGKWTFPVKEFEIYSPKRSHTHTHTDTLYCSYDLDLDPTTFVHDTWSKSPEDVLANQKWTVYIQEDVTKIITTPLHSSTIIVWVWFQRRLITRLVWHRTVTVKDVVVVELSPA